MKKNNPLLEGDKISLAYEQVREIIGAENMDKFTEFMNGQTCCMRSNHEIGYYPCDVEKFQQLIREKRNLTNVEWD
jgi:hypothetical protein